MFGVLLFYLNSYTFTYTFFYFTSSKARCALLISDMFASATDIYYYKFFFLTYIIYDQFQISRKFHHHH